MNTQVKKIVFMALMSAMGYILMFIQVPILPVAPWLTIDFSFVAILFISLAYSNLEGFIVAIVINLLNYLSVGSPVGVPVGQISNVLAIMSYLLIFVHFKKDNKPLLGSVLGCLSVTIIMVMANYLLITPWYFSILGYALPDNFFYYCITVIGLFNLIRWFIISLVNYILDSIIDRLIKKI